MANRFLSNIRINDAYTFPASDGTSGQVIGTDGAGNLSFINIESEAGSTVIYKDNFSGDNSTVTFTLAHVVSDEVVTQVYMDGVYQNKDTYIVSGDQLTFDSAPPTGVEIEVISFNTVSTQGIIAYNAKNSTGSTIAAGTAVMAVGTDGNSGHILIAPMVADGSIEPKYFMGVTAEEVLNGAYVDVVHFGVIGKINTSTFSDGDVLWLDPSNNGGFTVTEPNAPNIKMAAAIVLNSSTNGKIFVRVQGNEGLHELHDVHIENLANQDILVYNTTQGYWENSKTLGDITTGNITTSGTVDGVDISAFKTDYDSHTHTESEITDFGNYVTNVTHDAANTKLVVTTRDGATQDLDISQYIDDTNLAYIQSGTLDGATGIATFTRDDATTFTVDLSALLDDTDTNDFLTGATFNTADGVLTLNVSNQTDVTVDLDGRYLESYTETDTLATVTGRGATTTSDITTGTLNATKAAKNDYGIQIKGAFYGSPRLQLYDLSVDSNAHVGLGVDMSGGAYEMNAYFPRYNGYGRFSIGSWAGDFGTGQYVSGYNEKLYITESAAGVNVPLSVSGNITITGTISASGYNNSNWDTAYGWGDHSTAGYLTSFTESDPVYTSERDSLLLNKMVHATLLFSNLSDYNKPSGYSTMIQPSSYQNPLPSHGYYHIIARRDAGSGYGALLQSYNGHEIYHGNTTQSTSDISWYKIWTSGDFSSTNVSNWNTAYGWGDHAGLYLPVGGKAADSNLLDGIDSSNFFRTDGTYPNTDMNDTVEGYWHVASGSANLPVNYYGHRWDYDHVQNGQWVFQMYSPTSGDVDLWFRQKRDYAATAWQKVITSANIGSQSIAFGTTAASSRFGNILIGEGTYKNSITPIDDTNLNINTPSGAVYINTYTIALGSHRAPVFYDYNDTGYYIDPNGISRLGFATFEGDGNSYNARTSTGVSIGRYAGSYAYIELGATAAAGSWIDFSKADGQDYAGRIRYWNSDERFVFDTAGADRAYLHSSYFTHNSSLRAPIFYDSGNTAYYVNADATSNLYNLELSGAKHTYLYVTPGSGYEAMIRFNGSSGSTWYVGKRTSSELVGTTGLHFYSQDSGASVAGVTWTGDVHASSSHRAPIFYDSNNTSYFIDPSSNDFSMNLRGKRADIGRSDAWDAVGFGSLTNLHFQDHNQFWIGAGNGTWYTGTANSGLSTGASLAHDLLITTMQSTADYYRGITFGVDSGGNGAQGWRLGKWFSGENQAQSRLIVDGQLFAKAGNTDEQDFYGNNYDSYRGTAAWPGDTNAGWHTPSIVASSALQIQSGTSAVNSRKPQIQFHQYGYGGPAIEYDGPNKKLQIGEIGSSTQNRFNTFALRMGGGNECFVVNTDYAYHNSDMRSPIFYDSNNTGYYVDPASTTNLNTVYMNAQTWRGNITWNSGVNINVNGECSIDMYSGQFGVWNSNTQTWSIRAPHEAQVQIGEAGSRGLYVFGAITASGDITAFSDARVKTDIRPLEKSLEKVKQIQGVSYKRTDLEPEKEKIGFVAQEIMKVLPEVVTENEDGMYSVSYGNITALLVEAVKELSNKVEELENKLNGTN